MRQEEFAWTLTVTWPQERPRAHSPASKHSDGHLHSHGARVSLRHSPSAQAQGGQRWIPQAKAPLHFFLFITHLIHIHRKSVRTLERHEQNPQKLKAL